MNRDDGYIRQLRPEEQLRQREIEIPSEDVEKVVNLTRADRRRWARQQKKAEKRGGR